MTDAESLVRRKRFRRTLYSLAVALSLAVFPSETNAQQAPTRMVVEGRPVPLTNGVPGRQMVADMQAEGLTSIGEFWPRSKAKNWVN